MYYNGLSIGQNYKKAFKYYAASAEQGHRIAQYNLAIMYHRGIYIKQDMEKALSLYTLSADQGHKEAKEFLHKLSQVI